MESAVPNRWPTFLIASVIGAIVSCGGIIYVDGSSIQGIIAAVMTIGVVVISYATGRPHFVHRELENHWFAAVPFGALCGALASVLVGAAAAIFIAIALSSWNL
ncbi:MAG TPA: hypothetical protein VHY37_11415 [Tepidisphaeraceae bacterium]|jgi:hypothetical protein|nr:hypothetical protein [Tepidisphaeraceae bacterium]